MHQHSKKGLHWPAQNTALVSLEFLLVGRTSQDQLNILNPIRVLQEHQKTRLSIHAVNISKHSGLETDTVSCSWKDSLKRSFTTKIDWGCCLQKDPRKHFLETWRSVFDFYSSRKSHLFPGMLLYVMARICCCHWLFLVLWFRDSQLDSCTCPGCRHLHLSKWAYSPFTVNRNLVNKIDIMIHLILK